MDREVTGGSCLVLADAAEEPGPNEAVRIMPGEGKFNNVTGCEFTITSM